MLLTPIFAQESRPVLLSAVPTNFEKLRGYHPLSRRFPENFTRQNWSLNSPHLVLVAKKDSVCPLPRSVAHTNGISLISFPPPTKMFQFSGFPILADIYTNVEGSPIR